MRSRVEGHELGETARRLGAGRAARETNNRDVGDARENIVIRMRNHCISAYDGGTL